MNSPAIAMRSVVFNARSQVSACALFGHTLGLLLVARFQLHAMLPADSWRERR